MTTKVRKAVIPAAGLGTRFLPATKAQPKEMLPLIDTPVIHYVRQGEPRGLGHAVSAARQYVGNEPFVVMLGDDIMDPDVGVLDAMLAAFARHGRSVVALKTVEPTEISSYGCARVEPLDDDLVRIQEIVEKPSPEAAPSNLAVMGRYVFTPAIFDALDRVGPGRGGEIQLTDAIALLLLEEEVHGYPFEHGRWDTGNKLDYLRATMELALRRPELAPAFRKVLVELANKLDEE
jgi:UTP--glucose-1-phosphate uridylyltransferase